MHVTFLTHYFPPEVGAPQTRILESARLLQARGHEVTVLTGFPNYPDGVIAPPYRGRLILRETVEGIPTLRTAVYPAPNAGMVRRLANHASFAVSAVAAAELLPRPDVLIAESPPLFTAAAAVLVARRLRAGLVLNVADLWPESAVQLGAVSSPPVIAAATGIERFAYRYADAILVPVEGMRDTLLQRGWPAGKVVTLANAVDVERFAASAAEKPPVRSGATRVVYCGTVGLAQAVETLLDAASELQETGEDVDVRIIGDGAELGRLQALARSRRLDRVSFAGRVLREDVPGAVSAADVTVVTLRDLPLFRAARPTKILEYMAAGKPVVASAAGDVERLLTEADAGIACPPEDAHALAAAIRGLHRDPAEARRLGRNGRRYVEEHLSRRRQADELEGILHSVTGEERERARIARVYGDYADDPRRRRAWSGENRGNRRIVGTMYERVEREIRRAGLWPGDVRTLLDIGCGHGHLLRHLADRGAPPDALLGLDVLPARVAAARQALPGARIEVGDARGLPFAEAAIDVVVLSTVLSSVLDGAVRRAIAAEAMRVLRPGGIIVLYDSRFANPLNAQVRGVGRRELRQLFPRAALRHSSLTLIPPLARRLGPLTPAIYGALASLPPLRSHLLTVVRPSPR